MKGLRLALASALASGMLVGMSAFPAAACEPPKSCGSCWVEKDIPEKVDPQVLPDPTRLVWIECHS